MTDEDKRIDEVREHLQEIGVVCSQWAHLEFLFEVAFWWLVGLPNRKDDGRVLTSGLSLETLARKVCLLQHLKISDANDRKTLEEAHKRIAKIVDERNLAVHGIRSADPEGDTITITAELSRGRYKSKPQNLPLIRLHSLNDEIAEIIKIIQPLLQHYNVIE